MTIRHLHIVAREAARAARDAAQEWAEMERAAMSSESPLRGARWPHQREESLVGAVLWVAGVFALWACAVWAVWALLLS